MKPTPQRIRKNPLFLCMALMLANSVAFALNPDEWRHSQVLTVPQAGLVRISLPASTLDAAQPDLSDLRLLDPAGSEVSFLIEHPMPKPESIVRPQEFQSAIDAGSTTTVTLRMGSLGSIYAVTLDTPARRFIKSVKVENSADGVSWQEVAGSRPIFRLPGGA
jgi:hypothetical protein